MRLKARTVLRISTGPASGSSPTSSPRPSRSAAVARLRIGFAIRRPIKTVTTATPRAESRNDARKVQPHGGASGGGPTATFSQRPSRRSTGRGEPVIPPALRPVTMVVIVVIVVESPMVVRVDVVPEPAPQRCDPDPLAPDIESGGQIAGNGCGPGAGTRLVNQWLAGQREPYQVGARGRDDRAVEGARRVPNQPRHGFRAHHHVVPVRMSHRLDAFFDEEKDRDALRDGEREQQQQGETAGEAPRQQSHARSTPPANRYPPAQTVTTSFGFLGSRSTFRRNRLT